MFGSKLLACSILKSIYHNEVIFFSVAVSKIYSADIKIHTVGFIGSKLHSTYLLSYKSNGMNSHGKVSFEQ